MPVIAQSSTNYYLQANSHGESYPAGSQGLAIHPPSCMTTLPCIARSRWRRLTSLFGHFPVEISRPAATKLFLRFHPTPLATRPVAAANIPGSCNFGKPHFPGACSSATRRRRLDELETRLPRRHHPKPYNSAPHPSDALAALFSAVSSSCNYDGLRRRRHRSVSHLAKYAFEAYECSTCVDDG